MMSATPKNITPIGWPSARLNSLRVSLRTTTVPPSISVTAESAASATARWFITAISEVIPCPTCLRASIPQPRVVWEIRARLWLTRDRHALPSAPDKHQGRELMYKPFDLSGKVALVTGGNGGIGLGMADAL